MSWVRTKFVKQEMYDMDGDMLEAILMQITMRGDGHVWILGP